MRSSLLILALFSTFIASTTAFDTLMNAMDILHRAFDEENRLIWLKLGEHLKRKQLSPAVLVDMDSDALDALFQPILAEAEELRKSTEKFAKHMDAKKTVHLKLHNKNISF